MPNFNPFSSDNEDTSFEMGLPVNQAAKTTVKAVSAQTQAQIDATNKDIVNQLYGPSTPTEPGTDEANTAHTDQSNAATRAVTAQMGANKKSSTNQKTNQNTNQTPEEQAKMEKIRHELFGNYSGKYQSAPNAAHGLITNLDQEMEKARKEREQKEMQRKKEEEEEEQQKKEEEEKQKQELVSPAGKKTGFNMGKKTQQPVALTMAKTKTEINRGASG